MAELFKEITLKGQGGSYTTYPIGADAEDVLIKNASGTAYGDRDGHKNLQSKLNKIDSMIRTDGAVGNATGECATAFGISTQALSKGAHAEGDRSVANALYAHAEGAAAYYNGSSYLSTASGEGAHSEGVGSKATQIAAHAEGYITEANAKGAHAEGGHTITGCDYQHVQGKYNKVEEDKVHIIGWGDDEDNRKNIHTIDTKGNAEFAGNIAATELRLIDSKTNIKYYISIQSGQIFIQAKGKKLLADNSGGAGQSEYFSGEVFNKENWTFKLLREDGSESIIQDSELSYDDKIVTKNPFIVKYEERGEVYKCELTFDIYVLPEGLEDFIFTKKGPQFEITDWRGTHQGSPSDIMKFPAPSASSDQIIIRM